MYVAQWGMWKLLNRSDMGFKNIHLPDTAEEMIQVCSHKHCN